MHAFKMKQDEMRRQGVGLTYLIYTKQVHIGKCMPQNKMKCIDKVLDLHI